MISSLQFLAPRCLTTAQQPARICGVGLLSAIGEKSPLSDWNMLFSTSRIGELKAARLLAMLLVALCASPTTADEPDKGGDRKADMIEQLTERIDELEKRIAKLESNPVAPLAPSPLTPPKTHEPPSTAVPPNPAQPYGGATTPSENAPNGWQRFFFNGQWFYIVPVGEASASTLHSSR